MHFRNIQLTDKQPIEAVLSRLARNDSALGFANIYGMQDKYGTKFCIEDEVLYLRQDARIPGRIAYYLPLGASDMLSETAKLASMVSSEGPFAFVGITPEEKAAFEAAGTTMTFSTDRTFAEYIFRTEDIAEYRGHERAKKRQEANRFRKLYGAGTRIEPIGEHNLDAVAAYEDAWFHANLGRHMDSHHPLEAEHDKIMLELQHFEALDLEGIVMYIDDTAAGYAYGQLLPGGAFDVIVLKGTLSYRFIWRAMLQEIAKFVVDRAPLLNLEEDLGMPGLRQSKEGYGPCALLYKYQAVIEE
jgi:hypothetical protein